jgi:hypothetical protein
MGLGCSNGSRVDGGSGIGLWGRSLVAGVEPESGARVTGYTHTVPNTDPGPSTPTPSKNDLSTRINSLARFPRPFLWDVYHCKQDPSYPPCTSAESFCCIYRYCICKDSCGKRSQNSIRSIFEGLSKTSFPFFLSPWTWIFFQDCEIEPFAIDHIFSQLHRPMMSDYFGLHRLRHWQYPLLQSRCSRLEVFLVSLRALDQPRTHISFFSMGVLLSRSATINSNGCFVGWPRKPMISIPIGFVTRRSSYDGCDTQSPPKRSKSVSFLAFHICFSFWSPWFLSHRTRETIQRILLQLGYKLRFSFQ